MPVIAGIILSPALLLKSSAAEEQIPSLEDALTSLKAQWEENHQENQKALDQILREHAKKQRDLQAEANEIRAALCEAGKLHYCPAAQKAKNVDIVKLAKAVAMAETEDCTKGVGLRLNNCFGIKQGGKFVTYGSKQESYKAFMDMWLRVYGDTLPTRAMASRYTANDNPDRWLKVVTVVYNRD